MEVNLKKTQVMIIERVGKGGMDHVSQQKKKPSVHDSRVLKKQFHGKLDFHKII
jgi:hypothetical protein